MPVAVPLCLTPPFFFLILAPLDRLRIRSAELARSRVETERTNGQLQEFLASLTHEVRSPLSRMIAALRQIHAEPLNDGQRTRIGAVRYTGEALALIVDDLLDLSRGDGRPGGEEPTFALRPLVASIVSLHSARATAKGLTLAETVGDTVPDCLHGNVAVVRQILMTLMGNAVKATVKGAVAIRVDAARSPVASPHAIRFSVVDTGPGVVPGLHRDLLTPVQAASATAQPAHSGATGLSLPTCRQLVERAGGTMGFESVEGAGSTFWFVMHLPPAEPRSAGSETGALISGAAATRLPPADRPECAAGADRDSMSAMPSGNKDAR